MRSCEPPCRFHIDSPFRPPERARRVKAERSDDDGGEARRAKPLWSLAILGRLGNATAGQAGGPLGSGAPRRVRQARSRMRAGRATAGCARRENARCGAGSLGASLHRVKKEVTPFPACRWFVSGETEWMQSWRLRTGSSSPGFSSSNSLKTLLPSSQSWFFFGLDPRSIRACGSPGKSQNSSENGIKAKVPGLWKALQPRLPKPSGPGFLPPARVPASAPSGRAAQTA